MVSVEITLISSEIFYGFHELPNPATLLSNVIFHDQCYLFALSATFCYAIFYTHQCYFFPLSTTFCYAIFYIHQMSLYTGKCLLSVLPVSMTAVFFTPVLKNIGGIESNLISRDDRLQLRIEVHEQVPPWRYIHAWSHFQ